MGGCASSEVAHIDCDDEDEVNSTTSEVPPELEPRAVVVPLPAQNSGVLHASHHVIANPFARRRVDADCELQHRRSSLRPDASTSDDRVLAHLRNPEDPVLTPAASCVSLDGHYWKRACPQSAMSSANSSLLDTTHERHRSTRSVESPTSRRSSKQ